MTLNPALAERIRIFDLPPPYFDPLRATERTLEDFGLPVRPADEAPEAVAFWNLLFAKPLRFVQPQLSLSSSSPTASGLEGIERKAVLPQARPAAMTRRHFENSRNWSGLFLRPPHGERFMSVAGSWTVPTLGVPTVAPIHPDPGDPERDAYHSSIWLGLNGYRSYPNVTMPQLGTWQRLKLVNGQKVTDIAAWWQWWSNDVVTPIVKFDNLPVEAGDTILAAVMVVSSDEVIFYLKNQSTGDLTWLLARAPSRSEPLGVTAEWIVERPTTPGKIWPWRMPKLSDVTFQNCHAFSGPRIIGPRRLRLLENANHVRMQERFPNPYRSALISVPERTSPTSARVQYREG